MKSKRYAWDCESKITLLLWWSTIDRQEIMFHFIDTLKQCVMHTSHLFSIILHVSFTLFYMYLFGYLSEFSRAWSVTIPGSLLYLQTVHANEIAALWLCSGCRSQGSFWQPGGRQEMTFCAVTDHDMSCLRRYFIYK